MYKGDVMLSDQSKSLPVRRQTMNPYIESYADRVSDYG